MTGGLSNLGIRIGWAFSGGSTNALLAAGVLGFVELAGEGLAAGAGWAHTAAAQKIIMAAARKVFLMIIFTECNKTLSELSLLLERLTCREFRPARH
jgi:hypothetical protein